MSEDNRLDAEHYRLPRLTMRNWTLEFKESFKEYALKKGEPGEVLITGMPIDNLVNHDFDEDTKDMKETKKGLKSINEMLKN
jgi:hypothetical protein